MLRTLRLYYNYLLVRCGFRRALPAYFINRIPIHECEEPLVKWHGPFVRATIASMLDSAQANLPNGYFIKVISGYRSPWEQQFKRKKREEELRDACPEMSPQSIKSIADKEIANISGHATGGAVDVVLYKGKDIVDTGTAYLQFSDRTPTYSRTISAEQRVNRKILLSAMLSAGFINYPLEWWHFCYGDQMYAAYAFKHIAIYGQLANYP